MLLNDHIRSSRHSAVDHGVDSYIELFDDCGRANYYVDHSAERDIESTAPNHGVNSYIELFDDCGRANYYVDHSAESDIESTAPDHALRPHAFAMIALSEQQPSQRVRTEWEHRVVAEYASSAITQQYTWWLTRIGCSPPLIERAIQVALDELEHASLSAELVRLLGGVPTEIPNTALVLCETGDFERDIVVATVDIFCLHETVASSLFNMLRRCATQPSALAVLDRIVQDEPSHGRLGWEILDWMLAHGLGEIVNSVLIEQAPSMVSSLRQIYGDDPTTPELTEAERAWGLADASEYGPVVERALRGAVARRLNRRGLAIGDGSPI